jgi:hypothetical protein
MKGKPFTYLMIAINIAVWGYVIYLLIGWLSPKDEVNTGLNLNLPNTNKTKGLDSITQDPFLGGSFVIAKEKTNFGTSNTNRTLAFPKKENAIVPASNVVVVSPLTELKFHGIIKMTSNNKKTGLLSVHDSSFFLRENESFKNFKLMVLTADSSVFVNEKKVKTVMYKK